MFDTDTKDLVTVHTDGNEQLSVMRYSPGQRADRPAVRLQKMREIPCRCLLRKNSHKTPQSKFMLHMTVAFGCPRPHSGSLCLGVFTSLLWKMSNVDKTRPVCITNPRIFVTGLQKLRTPG